MSGDSAGIAASCEIRGTETWVRLEGELDNDGCDEVAPVFQNTACGRSDAVVVDMSGVTLVSSKGIGLLIKTQRELHEQGRTLMLHGLRPHIRKSFELVGALRVIAVRE